MSPVFTNAKGSQLVNDQREISSFKCPKTPLPFMHPKKGIFLMSYKKNFKERFIKNLNDLHEVMKAIFWLIVSVVGMWVFLQFLFGG